MSHSRILSRLSLLGLLGLPFALTVPLPGTALQQMSTAQMSAASTEIVQGTVTGSYTALSNRTIFTHYAIAVSQRWKGPSQPTADVAIPGGLFQGMRQSFPGVPELKTGRAYMLFLWQGASGPTQLVGLNQGVFEVSVDASGTPVVSRAAASEMMLDTQRRPVVDQAVHLKMAEMRRRVQAALAKGRAE